MQTESYLCQEQAMCQSDTYKLQHYYPSTSSNSSSSTTFSNMFQARLNPHARGQLPQQLFHVRNINANICSSGVSGSQNRQNYAAVFWDVTLGCLGACGSTVGEALCHKPEGRGFEIHWGKRIFSIHVILPVVLSPGVYSASNRNEYQKQKNNVSGEKSAAGA
jgi:hypothetical protein